jgi:radical SAM/Cys-rich protein
MNSEFAMKVSQVDPEALRVVGLDLLQLNIGLRCNMSCAHCHQSSSPSREEAMSDETFAACLRLGSSLGRPMLDLTGGAPELHPRIRDFVLQARSSHFEVQVRTNLTAMLEPGNGDMPEVFARHGVRLLASLPSWDPAAVERQRGALSFDKSIAVLRRLNALGYGLGDGLILDLAANPDGACLPDPKKEEPRFRHELLEQHGVRFDELRMLTNVPVGRFRAGLVATKALKTYLETLRSQFNPATIPLLACRRSLAVAWNGVLHDCDFNLGAGLPIVGGHRSVFEPPQDLLRRPIAFAAHCLACTAHAGSS